MSDLVAIRDQLKAQVAAHNEVVVAAAANKAGLDSLLEVVEAELAREPTAADIRRLLDRMSPP